MTQTDNRCYRPKRSFLFIGIACTGFALLMGAGSAAVAWWNLDGSFSRPVSAAVAFAAFWSCVALLGTYLIGVAVRSRLYVSPQSIQHFGCFLTKTMQLDEVRRAQWRLWPKDGSLLLRGISHKVTLEFGIFDAQDRRELILFFRNHLPNHIQEQWPQFESHFSPDLTP